MTNVTTILQEVCNRIENTIGIKPYLLEEIPTHFKEGDVGANSIKAAWDLTWFDIFTAIPRVRDIGVMRLAIALGFKMAWNQQAYALMKTCFNRAGATYTDAVIYKISYTNDIIMTNGTPYVTCTCTLTFKSMMNFD